MSGVHLELERVRPGPVCGVDEAGRGPWAGPVCAAAVILPRDARLDGLDDSKRLSARRRETAEVRIKAESLAWAVAFASVEEIGELNILRATGLAMRRAVEALSLAPVSALVDGDKPFDLPCPSEAVIGGDGISASIAAASILAKTARDRLMAAFDVDYPGYGFAAHKGYGVAAHAAALRALGPCPIHRMTWAPLRALVGG
jgi:ribonuclease HII